MHGKVAQLSAFALFAQCAFHIRSKKALAAEECSINQQGSSW